MKPLYRQRGGYCPLISVSGLLTLCSSTILSAVAHHNKEILHLYLMHFLSKLASLSFMNLILLKLCLFICLYIVLSEHK